MISDVNGLFSKATAELGNIRDCDVVQRPKRVLVERGRSLPESDLDAVGQQVILRYCPGWLDGSGQT
jgi:hypothetical protein